MIRLFVFLLLCCQASAGNIPRYGRVEPVEPTNRWHQVCAATVGGMAGFIYQSDPYFSEIVNADGDLVGDGQLYLISDRIWCGPRFSFKLPSEIYDYYYEE